MEKNMSGILLLSLPREIIKEILSRLPVQSILAFRCVCKSFLELFGDLRRDEEFVKLHLNNAIKNNHLNIMLTGNNRMYSVGYFDASPPSSCKKAIEINYPLKSDCNDKNVKIWGSCNGLLCFGIFEDGCICLWNPSTREYRKISLPSCFSVKDVSYGFGYDYLNDDYKLVRVSFGHDNKSEVQVYTLRTSLWRTLGKAPMHVPLYGKRGVYLHGCLHWRERIHTKANRHEHVIHTFRLSNEGFEVLSLPTNFDHLIMINELSVLRGCLCLVCTQPGCLTDVWLMTEYGVVESWTVLFTIYHDTIDKYYLYTSEMVFPLKNGEILSQSNVKRSDDYEWLGCFILYDEKKKTIRDVTIEGLPNEFQAETCLQSFVSL